MFTGKTQSGKDSKNMEYLMNVWRGIVESKSEQGPIYAEGGPLKPDGLQGMCELVGYK